MNQYKKVMFLTGNNLTQQTLFKCERGSVKIIQESSILSAAVAVGGYSPGWVSSHVLTNQLLMWDTPEVFAAILTV
jgi:hypothetical protein